MTLRPLRRRLSDESVALMDEQRAQGMTPLPVHLMLVEEIGSEERGRSACGGGLGEWVTGASEQVTCAGCLAQMHARNAESRPHPVRDEGGNGLR